MLICALHFFLLSAFHWLDEYGIAVYLHHDHDVSVVAERSLEELSGLIGVNRVSQLRGDLGAPELFDVVDFYVDVLLFDLD